MLARWLRRYFGSIRLFMTLLVVLLGTIVVLLDLRYALRLSAQLYGFLTALSGTVAVFVWKDTDRPVGYDTKGVQYPPDGGNV
jgi:hypothetical protein